MKNKPVLIVAGQPNSTFLEIFFKSIHKRYKSPLILICSRKILKKKLQKFKIKKNIRILNNDNLKKYKIDNQKINLIDIPYINTNKRKINFDRSYMNECFETAFKILKSKYTNKLINGPINKKLFLNKKYLGITELISNKFKKNKVGMLIYNKKLSVSPLTTHLPIQMVPKMITKKILKEKIKVIDNFYRHKLKYRPIIAVTGLNPHCESILKFNEDEKIITPIVKSLTKEGINVKGPFPADTIFLKANRKKFDVILGMYHDQVLSPIKTIFEYDAINITMGLPFWRVSPDHGPNITMIGKNKSNPLSLIRSLEFLDNK